VRERLRPPDLERPWAIGKQPGELRQAAGRCGEAGIDVCMPRLYIAQAEAARQRRRGKGVRPKAWLSWSSGKDSAWTLHEVRRRGELEVTALLTTINQAHQRVAMHAVRESLLEAQASAAGLPLVKVPLPSPCPNAAYEEAMDEAMAQARAEGVTHVIFGDLFLADIRKYREAQLARCGMTPVFPLWLLDTRELARAMVGAGLRAFLTCVDPSKLDRSFAGREFDGRLLAELPEHVDPCGENGEFHTFACAGPMFRAPIAVEPGEVVERDGFVFADLLPAGLRPPKRRRQGAAPPAGSGPPAGS
jgi:uncharacterized protein (TIGR00290 family)